MHNAALRPPSRHGARGFTVLRPHAFEPVLLICDHASNHVPAAFGGLGLSRDELARHIGWDIGAADVTHHLSRYLRATAVLSGVSRLVIDCNRPIGHPTSIPPVSDGTEVPGNRNLSREEAETRAAAWFHPYHRAVAGHLARLERMHRVATLVSIHSFTPEMNGNARPWSIGVLWHRDPRLAPAAIAALRRRGHLVGDNEPYSGRGGAFTVDTHAAAHGRPHITFEIRQDLIGHRAGARHWAGLLAEILMPLLRRREVRRRTDPSRA